MQHRLVVDWFTQILKKTVEILFHDSFKIILFMKRMFSQTYSS